MIEYLESEEPLHPMEHLKVLRSSNIQYKLYDCVSGTVSYKSLVLPFFSFTPIRKEEGSRVKYPRAGRDPCFVRPSFPISVRYEFGAGLTYGKVTEDAKEILCFVFPAAAALAEWWVL